MVIPMFLGEYPKSIFFLFIYKMGVKKKKKKNLVIGMPKVRFITLFLKALKAV